MNYHPRQWPSMYAVTERAVMQQGKQGVGKEQALHEAATMLAGATRRIDCESCGDTKARLWIGKADDGKRVNWKCHKCQEQGTAKIFPKLAITKPTNNQQPPSVITADNVLGSVVVTVKDPDEWPSWARTWLLRFIPATVAVEMGVFYSPVFRSRKQKPSDERLVLPVYDGKRLVLCQGRGSFPKYRDLEIEEGYRYKPIVPSYNVFDSKVSVVLCEDWVSACKIGWATDWETVGVCLWGTSFDSKRFLAEWKGKAKNVIIWLDNDNRTVRERAERIGKELGMVFPTKVIRGQSDPKLQSKQRIRNLVATIKGE